MKTDYDDFIFCSNCDYAITKEERDSSVVVFYCPRCNMRDISDFYYYGSDTHKHRRTGFKLGHIKGSPLPFPIKLPDINKSIVLDVFPIHADYIKNKA